MSDGVSNNQREADVERLKRAAQQLGEHFETVHIFCSRHMPAELDGTVCVNQGLGHWHARYGQIREWVNYHDELVRISARRSQDDE